MKRFLYDYPLPIPGISYMAAGAVTVGVPSGRNS